MNLDEGQSPTERQRAADELKRIEDWCSALRQDYLARLAKPKKRKKTEAKGAAEHPENADSDGALAQILTAIESENMVVRLEQFAVEIEALSPSQRERAQAALESRAETLRRQEFSNGVDNLQWQAAFVRRNLIEGNEVIYSYGQVIALACRLGFETWAGFVGHSQSTRGASSKAAKKKATEADDRLRRIQNAADDISAREPSWLKNAVAAAIVENGLAEGLKADYIRRKIKIPTNLSKP